MPPDAYAEVLQMQEKPTVSEGVDDTFLEKCFMVRMLRVNRGRGDCLKQRRIFTHTKWTEHHWCLSLKELSGSLDTLPPYVHVPLAQLPHE